MLYVTLFAELLSSYDNFAVKVIQQTNQLLMFGYTMLYAFYNHTIVQGRLNVSLKGGWKSHADNCVKAVNGRSFNNIDRYQE